MKIIYRIVNTNYTYDDWLYELTYDEGYCWRWLGSKGISTYPTIYSCPEERGMDTGTFLPKIPFKESDFEYNENHNV